MDILEGLGKYYVDGPDDWFLFTNLFPLEKPGSPETENGFMEPK